ncbi:MAG: hypothetical protein LBL83_02445, partial [Clostridiales bacterium]|nr:hypothetical protein [Clostridiales bacterium]
QGGDGRHRVEASLDAPVSSLGAASSFFAPGRLTAVASWELSRQGGSDSARLIAGTRAPDGGITPSLELLLEASEQGGGSGSGGGGGSGGNGGGSYVLAAELGLYDSARRQAGAGESAGAAGESAGENADGSAGSGAGGGAGGLPAGSRLTGGAEPMLALSAEATVTFGPVSVPNLADAELAYGGAGGAAQTGGNGGADGTGGAAGGNAGESGAAPASGTAYLTAESFSDGTAEALMADVQNGLMGFAFSNLQLFSQYINLQDLY